jgi:hypothetical protein
LPPVGASPPVGVASAAPPRVETPLMSAQTLAVPLGEQLSLPEAVGVAIQVL